MSDPVHVHELNWMQLEAYLQQDDRAVIPLGSTEQHAYLSLGTDTILSERVAVEAAEPAGVPVFPALPYGLTPAFAAFPGSPTLRLETFVAVVRDVLESLHGQGFRRFLVVNGHGGNAPAGAAVREWAASHPDAQVVFHSWWDSARVRSVAASVADDAAHANWYEDFPWTRLAGADPPDGSKRALDLDAYRVADPAGVRELLGDGSFGGRYRRPDEDVLHVWEEGVAEVRELLEGAWRP